MQLAVIAFARDILGWTDANTNENNSKTKHPVIHLMPAQKNIWIRESYGGTMRLGSWDAKVKKVPVRLRFMEQKIPVNVIDIVMNLMTNLLGTLKKRFSN